MEDMEDASRKGSAPFPRVGYLKKYSERKIRRPVEGKARGHYKYFQMRNRPNNFELDFFNERQVNAAVSLSPGFH